MNNYQKTLYEDLVKLTDSTEAFFFKDFTLDDQVYRIFNYRLASWTEFQLPGGLDARGIMFNITDPNNVFVVSMPPQKFFNYEEGGVDHTSYAFGDKMVKMDGSLISTYLHQGNLFLKSKASLFSEQALSAMKLLNQDENQDYKAELTKLVKDGYTVNLEYTSPDNRIVIPYQEEKLTILSVRRHEDGFNTFATRLRNFLDSNGYKELQNHLVQSEQLHDQTIEHSSFVEAVRAEQEGEGYVVELLVSEQNSYLVKLKNIKYITLHQTKDSVNSDKRLFEAVIEEATDDLRGMFFDDPYVLEKIEAMENKVRPVYNHIIKTVEDFYETNKNLSRKDYAILAKAELPKFMPLCMNAYLGYNNDYKDFSKKHRKDIFGVEDIVHDPEEAMAHMKNSMKTSFR